MRRLVLDDKGQATTEYILMLAIIVGLTIIAIKTLIRPVYEALRENLTKRIDETLFKEGNLHHIRIGK